MLVGLRCFSTANEPNFLAMVRRCSECKVAVGFPCSHSHMATPWSSLVSGRWSWILAGPGMKFHLPFQAKLDIVSRTCHVEILHSKANRCLGYSVLNQRKHIMRIQFSPLASQCQQDSVKCKQCLGAHCLQVQALPADSLPHHKVDLLLTLNWLVQDLVHDIIAGMSFAVHTARCRHCLVGRGNQQTIKYYDFQSNVLWPCMKYTISLLEPMLTWSRCDLQDSASDSQPIHRGKRKNTKLWSFERSHQVE